MLQICLGSTKAIATVEAGVSEPLLACITRTWDEVKPLLRMGPCRGCECLQGLLVELQGALEDLPPSTEQAALLAAISGVKLPAERHACLGCDPCTPGTLLADFYRARNAVAAEVAASARRGAPSCGENGESCGDDRCRPR